MLAAQDQGTVGHMGHASRRLGVEKPPLDALRAWEVAELDPRDQDAALALQSSLEADACRLREDDKLKERGDVDGEQREEEHDSLNVDELSELFSCVEQEEASGVDFGVFVEDEDAINVEEISELFSCLEESKKEEADRSEAASPVAVDSKCDSQPVDGADELDIFSEFEQAAETVEAEQEVEQEQEQALADAANVDMLSEMFSAALEDKDAGEQETPSTMTTYTVADCDDSKNVDLVAELFTSLEAGSSASLGMTKENSLAIGDWIDALEVDNVASLFAELEQADATKTKTQSNSMEPVSAAPVKLDSRVFVPTFSVRIDGQRSGPRPPIGVNSDLLVGPPCAVLTGPPASTREDRVGRWKAKRKTRSFETKQPDPSISDTRRASAAKRQRVKGRFIRDTRSFVSITALQH